MEQRHVWVGLPLKLVLQDDTYQFNAGCHDHGRDISVLTSPQVQSAIFFLSEEVEELYELANKICSNLGKSLIVITNDSYDTSKCSKHSVSQFVKLKAGKSTAQQLASALVEISPKASSSNAINRLSKIDVFIDKNINRDIREEEVASLANFSTTYFSKFFRKHKKISFQDYLSNKRVELSKQLLASHPSEKVSSIAFQVGYSDVSYFNRVFKKHTSLTPTEYRQNVVR
ncbi:two-component response regulator yesN [Vibrio ishigakensis]|uniref:Two-component response regulator yesN n=1 Tax=Vibrio ishigakensis TaxID=1481914 RepID=A0A0B8QIS6_9VIBR|nr:two-component response regulator yesN [Vibrio ishigakensis]